jgi:peptidyl-prolyl cis-trans isomerase B (cyclophilin B)
VIDGFMIQGGGFTPAWTRSRSRRRSKNEAEQRPEERPLHRRHGAHLSDPHSATAQFFINVGDNDFLERKCQDGWGYCVFGRVVEGQDVVDKIKASRPATRASTRTCRSIDVVIERAEVV